MPELIEVEQYRRLADRALHRQIARVDADDSEKAEDAAPADGSPAPEGTAPEGATPTDGQSTPPPAAGDEKPTLPDES